jgi:hypothetical protein
MAHMLLKGMSLNRQWGPYLMSLKRQWATFVGSSLSSLPDDCAAAASCAVGGVGNSLAVVWVGQLLVCEALSY